jgi:hypothetical protein
VVVNGVHTVAQAPEQFDFPVLSRMKRYSARPDGPTRYVPLEPFAVLTITPPPEVLAVVEAGAEVEDEPELLPPHAAATNATPTATTPLAYNLGFL